MSEQKVAIVTGASAGIGKSAARMLAAQGWRVIGVGRDPQRSAAAEAEIKSAAAPDAKVDFVRGDFSLMKDVKRVANEIKTKTDRIDVLINNAGGVRDAQYITAEGTEATFTANHLAPFLLTRELLPLLKATAKTSPAGSVRVIAVASTAHRMSQGWNWDDLQSIKNFVATPAYAQAKLANIWFTRELARRVAADGIVAQAMHPGIVDSNFASHADNNMKTYFAASTNLVSPDEPGETLVWMATAAEAGVPAGRYFHRKAEETPSDVAQDDASAARLWIESEKLLTELGV